MVQFHTVSSKVARFFQPNQHNSIDIKRAIIATTAVATLSIGSVYAANTDKDPEDVSTIYHVYHKGELIGSINDKSIIDNIVKERVKDAKLDYQGYDISVKDQIVYIPEKVYTSTHNNSVAVNKLNEKFDISAKAEAIVVNGKTVAFVSTKEDADVVLKKIKMKYVPEEVLLKLAINPDGVEHNDYIYKDVTLSENVTFSEGKVFPEDILSVDEAVELLLKGTLQPKIHEVQEGEVLGQIANDYDLTLKQLLQLNPEFDEEEMIHIGDEINVTAYKPLVTVKVKMEAIRKEVIPFGIEVEEDKNMFKGTTKVKQEGVNGERLATYSIIQENGQNIYKTITNEKVLKEPKKKIMIKGTKVIPSRGTGDFAWPTVGGYVSSDFGYRWGKQHKGMDIARPSNRTIMAADNGTVEFAGWDGGYGNKIVINHNNGMKTVYAHLSEISVKVGQTVSKGSKIGIMGTTGNSTGIHLHFEVYKNGSLVNPKKVL
ncbi:M23 family metallopeptidase [Calidifontibacillus oryziterrae]|uniref:M23 family metallopeptidase n=1 Tax=Calidifontibacillus oryziterrae TaxID=1191699 RepID=UPI0002D62363|nr:M23 family metallopeptidase [Calidifontibacillus oryziterrae]